jgi:hypothetical protein
MAMLQLPKEKPVIQGPTLPYCKVPGGCTYVRSVVEQGVDVAKLRRSVEEERADVQKFRKVAE